MVLAVIWISEFPFQSGSFQLQVFFHLVYFQTADPSCGWSPHRGVFRSWVRGTEPENRKRFRYAGLHGNPPGPAPPNQPDSERCASIRVQIGSIMGTPSKRTWTEVGSRPFAQHRVGPTHTLMARGSFTTGSMVGHTVGRFMSIVVIPS